jgi:hypothetical protein
MSQDSGSCDPGNDPAGSLKCWEFLDELGENCFSCVELVQIELFKKRTGTLFHMAQTSGP